jgi:hypothetical protein
MPGLTYPFVYECSRCDNETTVERSDARDLAPDPDSAGALDIVLESRGWVRGPDQLYCSECASEFG